ncbi:hypothetical protein BRIN106911_03130 [Brevibacillus invocatus]|nr:hypothetical protein [Brevibacillus invocatus]
MIRFDEEDTGVVNPFFSQDADGSIDQERRRSPYTPIRKASE